MPTLVERGCARGGLWPVLLCALWMTEVFSVAVPARQGIALLRRYCLFLAYFAKIFIKHTMRMTLDRFDRFDRFDRQILDILQTDGRINNQDLADRIGLSPSPCLRRVRALEECGLIVGYRALLDARKLGLTLMALVHISMDRHTPERFANFEASVSVLPEVLECLLITGQDADYQLKVVVRDMDHYQALLLDKLTRITGVTGVHSSFVLRRVVDKTALALG
jgi:Lrp/AsnC family transcriptional regulator, leucine-responsive regulatory protein